MAKKYHDTFIPLSSLREEWHNYCSCVGDETIGMDGEEQEEAEIKPLNEWMTDHMVPQFMEEQGISEREAREMLSEALPVR